MRVAISGVQGVGKTTLINELKNLNNPNLTFLDEIVRSLPKTVKINENGNDETQNVIMEKHLNFIKETDNNKINITDRCLLDCLAYGLKSAHDGKVSIKTITKHMKIFFENIDVYDVIFYIEPEFNIIEDGIRSTDIEYRDEVKMRFDALLALRTKPVVVLSGSVENRIKQIKEVLKI